jgi:hypothetical protein
MFVNSPPLRRHHRPVSLRPICKACQGTAICDSKIGHRVRGELGTDTQATVKLVLRLNRQTLMHARL